MSDKQRRRSDKLLQRRWTRLGLDGLPPEERDFILLWELNAEVSNGTFDQYLSNSSGDHAPEAVAALERLGSIELLSILRLVLDALPGGWCADQDARAERARAVPEDVFRFLTDEYYRAIVSEASVGDRASERVYTAHQRAGLLDE